MPGFNPSKIVVLITGANQGVGYETAKILLAHSAFYHVLIGARDQSKGQAALSTLLSLPETKGTGAVVEIDVSNDASVDAAAAEVERSYGRVDVLVNNAGVVSADPSPRNNLRAVLDVNVTGALSATEAFLPLLRKCASRAPRLVFVSSSLGSIAHAADPESKYYRPQFTQYRASKAALNMIMVQYWVQLQLERADGLRWIVHGADPGLTATNLTGNAASLAARGAVAPEVGGERIAAVVRGDRDADVGRVCGEYGVSPW
ncbi:putative carbonyl reductase [Exidia glandulosa HHB12029]|uniref:Putative carbonyl reductase n=1 Tax=Exidia glandulosa HHB12029 TaxID=1314781 RepID=A0A165MJZ5_EXIGL|nr:putative carbonyl reductase [Exidia glandulosa HHB12029]